MDALLSDLERSGPEMFGGPLRAVAVLSRDVGDLGPTGGDVLAARRQRGAAARVARRALSLASLVQGAIADRPESSRAWSWNVREVAERMAGHPAPDADADAAAACLRNLARVADLVLMLPQASDGEDWQLGAIAFADEQLLAELREACLELALAALHLADAGA
jgi:hypothetical protein